MRLSRTVPREWCRGPWGKPVPDPLEIRSRALQTRERGLIEDNSGAPHPSVGWLLVADRLPGRQQQDRAKLTAMRTWILVTFAVAIGSLGGCSSTAPPVVQTPNDVVNALAAAGVECENPEVDGPKSIAEAYSIAKPASMSRDAAALYEEITSLSGSWARIECATGNDSERFSVTIASDALWDADCAYHRQAISDHWDETPVEERQRLRTATTTPVVLGEGWVAKPSDSDNVWPALAQPADLARALGGDVATNVCEFNLPS